MCSCRFSYVRLDEVCGVQRALIKGGVRALRVVEPDPIIDDAFCLEAVSDFVQINGLLLERPPQPFDEDVIEVATPTIH